MADFVAGQARDAAPGPASEAIPDLLSRFESLGEDCEFGLVQRYVGIEPLGLFRFNYSPRKTLQLLLQDGLERICSPGCLSLHVNAGQEYIVRISPFGFVYHSFMRVGQIGPEDLLAREYRRLAFLARKFREDAALGEKIFVRQDNVDATEVEMRGLHGALGALGPSFLLWVTTQTPAHPPGTVEYLGDRLMRGYLDRPAAMVTDIHWVSTDGWVMLCQAAAALRSRIAGGQTILPGHTVPGVASRAQPNLFPAAKPVRARSNLIGLIATVEEVPDRFFAHEAVLRHALTEDVLAGFNPIYGLMARDLEAGEIYSVSAYVWLPEHSPITRASLNMVPLASLTVRRADPAIRGRWQRIWSSARTKDAMTQVRATIFVLGQANAHFYSTAWKIEKSVIPTPFPAQDAAALVSPSTMENA